jgi:DNA end-binding protein Ku
VLAKRERVMALEPYERGLLGTTLHYPYEVRHANDYFADIPELTPAPELLRLAEHILDSKLQTFDTSGFRDRYEEALMAHLKARQAGMPPQPKQNWAAPRRAINLMEALRRSLAEDKKAEAPRRPAPAPAPARKWA